MKRIIYILSIVFLALSCEQKETYGPSVFELQMESQGEMLFAYGATKQVPVVAENIKVCYVKCLKGWSGGIENQVLSITAPAEKTEETQEKGKVGIYARGYDDVEYILYLDVKVSDDAKEGSAANFTASFEGDGIVERKWQNADRIRVYDELDSDGFEFEPALSISEDGLAETDFKGIISDGAQNIVAVYPSDKSLALSSEGVITGLSLQSEQIGVLGSYSEQLFRTVANVQDGRLVFKSPYAYLKVEIGDEMVKSVSVEGSESLAGTYTYDAASMTATFVTPEPVSLVPVDGRECFAPGVYYITVLPTEQTGLSLNWVTADGKTKQKQIVGAIVRNEIKALGTIIGAPEALDKAGWQILYCNSELTQDFSAHNYVGLDGDSFTGVASDMIDGDDASFWTYNYFDSADYEKVGYVGWSPFQIVIDLGEQKTFDTFRLTAQEADMKKITGTAYNYPVGNMDIEFANSITDRGVGDIIDRNKQSCWSGKESFDNTMLKNVRQNTVRLSQTQTARYVRLTIYDCYKGNTATESTWKGGRLAEFDLFNGDAQLDKSSWNIVYAKSESLGNYQLADADETNYNGWTGAARHMIDGNYWSMWNYNSSPKNSTIPSVRLYPYWIVIDFGKEITISQFQTTARRQNKKMDDASTFNPGPAEITFEFATRISGRGMDDILEDDPSKSEWTVHTQTFGSDVLQNRKYNVVEFSEPVTARYVRLKITKSYANATESTPTRERGCDIAELDFIN